MKRFTKIFLAINFCFLFAGITQAQDVNNPNGYVQVYDVASVSKLELNKYDQYTFENDTVIINYIFWTSQGKMNVKITNKLEVPIYINWSQSTFNIEGVALPLSPYVEKLSDVDFKLYEKYKSSEPTLTDMDYEWKRQSNTGAETALKDQTVEILPKSSYTKSNYYLTTRQGIVLDVAIQPTSVEHSSTKNTMANVYKAVYTNDNSPIKFGCDIVINTDKTFTSKSSVVKQSFFVEAIREMDAKHFRGKKVGQTPEGFLNYKFPEKKSSSFYLEIDRRTSIEFNKVRK